MEFKNITGLDFVCAQLLFCKWQADNLIKVICILARTKLQESFQCISLHIGINIPAPNVLYHISHGLQLA
jgi:hypothetical protein